MQMEPGGQVYKVNRNGPRTDPCGTPNVNVTGDDLTLPTLTIWVLPVRYDLIHSKAVSLIPN